jgi:hypothetical protein
MQYLVILGSRFLAAAAAIPALVQEPLFEIRGTRVERVGDRVGAAGDHDRDGIPDFLIAREFGPGRASIEIRSGRSGVVLRAIDLDVTRTLDGGPAGIPTLRQGLLGGLGSARDVDGDGVPDVLAGGLVFGGATGRVLIQPSDELLPSLVAHGLGLGDVDGDERDDVVVGTSGLVGFCPPGASLSFPVSPGWIAIYSGSGRRLFGLSGPLLGGAIGELDDLDGDGIRDFAAARSFASPCVTASSGLLEARSGATGDVLWQTLGGASSLARLSDVDGDGVPDLATLLAGGVQEVTYRSGRTGDALTSMALPEGGAAGWSGGLVTLDDLDGDGALDLAVGAPQPTFPALDPELFQIGPGYVTCLSGRSGAEILRLEGHASDGEFGASLACPGDLDGDGLPELVVGSPGHFTKDANGTVVSRGRVVVLSLGGLLARGR